MAPRPGRHAARASATALALALVVSSTRAQNAQDAQPSADRIKAAAEEFDLGRRAFIAKDFEGAAGHFENAFRDAPSKETLRLAIRARREAKQPARAATLAALAQERFASDAATRELAGETIAATAKELGELVVECSAPCTVAADGRVVSQADGTRHRLFLDPGPHELGIGFAAGAGSASVARHVDVRKGTMTPLAFEPPPPKEPAVVASTPAEPPRPAAAEKPLGPAVFFVAAGVTILAGAATIVSGVATEIDPGADAVRAACAGQGEACALYQEGQDAETRTNVLLGVTVGAALVTGVIGLFFTRWNRF